MAKSLSRISGLVTIYSLCKTTDCSVLSSESVDVEFFKTMSTKTAFIHLHCTDVSAETDIVLAKKICIFVFKLKVGNPPNDV